MRQQNAVGSGIGGVTNGVMGILSSPWFTSLLKGAGSMFGGGGFDLGGGTVPGIDSNWLENMFPGGSADDIMTGLNLDPGADWGALFGGLGGP